MYSMHNLCEHMHSRFHKHYNNVDTVCTIDSRISKGKIVDDNWQVAHNQWHIARFYFVWMGGAECFSSMNSCKSLMIGLILETLFEHRRKKCVSPVTLHYNSWHLCATLLLQFQHSQSGES